MKRYLNVFDFISLISGLAGCIVYIIGIASKISNTNLSDSLRYYGLILLLISAVVDWSIRFYKKKYKRFN